MKAENRKLETATQIITDLIPLADGYKDYITAIADYLPNDPDAKNNISDTKVIIDKAKKFLMSEESINDNIEIKDLIKELLPIVEDVIGGMSCFPNHNETQKEKRRFEDLILKLKLFLK